jgi:hypothetical protein
MDAEREWWRRTLMVLRDPRHVFAALGDESREDLEARQEPVLALVWLGGIAWLFVDPVSRSVLDNPEYDTIVTLVWAFVAGGAVGFVGYFFLGAALALGLRAAGSTGSYRRARHLLAFAAVPLVLSLTVVLVRLVAFGGDALRSGGDDDSAAGTVLTGIQLAFGAWSLALLAVGVRTVESWAWGRVLASFALLALFFVALSVVAGVLV